jgi:hypothetical protein
VGIGQWVDTHNTCDGVRAWLHDVWRLVFAGTHARNHRACVGVGVWLVQEQNHEDDHGAHSDADRAASLHPANGGLCVVLCVG